MKKLVTLVLAVVLLTPVAGFASSATDAALGLGAFAVANQILGGVGVFGGYAAPAPAYAVPAPVYAVPAPVYAVPAPVYVAPRPVFFAPPRVVVVRPVVVAPRVIVRPFHPVFFARPVAFGHGHSFGHRHW